jgi:hypothetical protein
MHRDQIPIGDVRLREVQTSTGSRDPRSRPGIRFDVRDLGVEGSPGPTSRRPPEIAIVWSGGSLPTDSRTDPYHAGRRSRFGSRGSTGSAVLDPDRRGPDRRDQGRTSRPGRRRRRRYGSPARLRIPLLLLWIELLYYWGRSASGDVPEMFRSAWSWKAVQGRDFPSRERRSGVPTTRVSGRASSPYRVDRRHPETRENAITTTTRRGIAPRSTPDVGVRHVLPRGKRSLGRSSSPRPVVGVAQS